jgi:hypothetical protein
VSVFLCLWPGIWRSATTSSISTTSRTSPTSRPTPTTRASAMSPLRRWGFAVALSVHLARARIPLPTGNPRLEHDACSSSCRRHISTHSRLRLALTQGFGGRKVCTHPGLLDPRWVPAVLHRQCGRAAHAIPLVSVVRPRGLPVPFYCFALMRHSAACAHMAGGPLQARRSPVWHRLPHVQCRGLRPVCDWRRQHGCRIHPRDWQAADQGARPANGDREARAPCTIT